MHQIGPCLILWMEFDYQAPMDEATSSLFGSLLVPYWRESEVQLTEKQVVLLMHDRSGLHNNTTQQHDNNNAPLTSSSDVVGEVTLKTSVDGYQLLKVNEMIKNAVVWRVRMPKTSKFSKYFNNNAKEGNQGTQEPKVHINEATLKVMGQAAKDFRYREQEFVKAVEMYQYFGNQNLEDVPIPNSQDYRRPDGYYKDVHSMDKHFVDICIIAVGPTTGTVFPISSLDIKINALYDTGAMKSCMSLKTFESLKLKLTKDRCPFIVTATRTSMEPVGFTECSFDINGHSFTQKFIVCNNQT